MKSFCVCFETLNVHKSEMFAHKIILQIKHFMNNQSSLFVCTRLWGHSLVTQLRIYPICHSLASPLSSSVSSYFLIYRSCAFDPISALKGCLTYHLKILFEYFLSVNGEVCFSCLPLLRFSVSSHVTPVAAIVQVASDHEKTVNHLHW